MFEVKMSQDDVVPLEGSSEAIHSNLENVESVQDGDGEGTSMCHSFSDVAELRESGEWAIIGCKCTCPSMTSSMMTSSSMTASENGEKHICTCKTSSSINTDCSSNCSSSDVAVINESDPEDTLNDLDGIPRISDLNLLNDKSVISSLTTDENPSLNSKSLSRKSSRLRLRLKKSVSNKEVALGERLSVDDSIKRGDHKKLVKKSSKNVFITNKEFLTIERNTLITIIIGLMIVFFVLALLSCLILTFLSSKSVEKIEPKPKVSLLFSQIDDLEKEFLECLKSKGKEISSNNHHQDCVKNLNFWKNSLAELLSNENERIKNLIEKLEEIDDNSKKSNSESESERLIGQSSSTKEPVHSESEQSSSIKETVQSDRESLQTLKNQMEELENLYNLEKSESLKWKKLFEERNEMNDKGKPIPFEENIETVEGIMEDTDQETIEDTDQETIEDTDQETIEDTDQETEQNGYNFLPDYDYDSLWKGIKETAENLNPHLEKFGKKLSKVVKDNLNGAKQLGDKLRKKLARRTQKLAKKLEKLRKAWNEDDNNNNYCDSEDCRETDDNKNDQLHKLRDKARWYTNRLKNLKDSRFLSDDDEPSSEFDQSESNWVFKRAKGRQEKQHKSRKG